MTKTYCDKCGCECIKLHTIFIPCGLYEYKQTYLIDAKPHKKIELCEDCLDKLKNWLSIKE